MKSQTFLVVRDVEYVPNKRFSKKNPLRVIKIATHINKGKDYKKKEPVDGKV